MTKLPTLIRAMPQGRIHQISISLGVARITIGRLVNHGHGSDDLAKRVAAYVGYPTRWAELLVKPKRTKKPKPSPLESSTVEEPK